MQPRRAAQDAYAQSRADSREPLMMDSGARAGSERSQPGSTPAPSDSQALSSPSHHREQEPSDMSDCFIKQALIARGYPTYNADILKQAVL